MATREELPRDLGACVRKVARTEKVTVRLLPKVSGGRPSDVLSIRIGLGRDQDVPFRMWVRIQRPVIVVVVEMSLESCDLSFSLSERYYEAPLHMNANGGTFMIDDFGRRRVAPRDLLNRWIVPLEHQFDFLTLRTGQMFHVPFLLMLIVATNLEVDDVTDPAILRRMGYRMFLAAPSPERYAEIFRRYAAQCGIDTPALLVSRLLHRYEVEQRERRGCEPRDLIERARDVCRFRRVPFELTEEVLDRAWSGYFGARQLGG
jgi:predicted ATPase with chaperone activity